MKRYVYFFILCFLMGCSAVQEVGEDYMNIDEYDPSVWPEVGDRIKYDYLNAVEPSLTPAKKTEYIRMAYDHILATKYKDLYEIRDPKIDTDVGMPETAGYVFIHFLPKAEDSGQIKKTTYLVVISRMEDRVVYSGIYSAPEGDPFYRYHEILKKIRE